MAVMRGSASFDEKTNTVIVTETPARLADSYIGSPLGPGAVFASSAAVGCSGSTALTALTIRMPVVPR